MWASVTIIAKLRRSRKSGRHAARNPRTPQLPSRSSSPAASPAEALPTMRRRPDTIAHAPYRPDEASRLLRRCLADVEQTAVIPAVPAVGPAAVRLPPHSTVDVPMSRPSVANSAPSTTSRDEPPVELAAMQVREFAVRTLCHADEPWFREDPAVARDRSLRAFQDRWADPAARQVVLNGHASPRTLVFSTAGFSAFDGLKRSA